MPDFKGPGEWRRQADEARDKSLKGAQEPDPLDEIYGSGDESTESSDDSKKSDPDESSKSDAKKSTKEE